MKKVITYGTFDLLHFGHVNLLNKAKALGDYLIVGVTSDFYDQSRGKLNVKQTVMERIENIKKLQIADEIIIEEFEGQKLDDIIKYNIDIFAIGSDWLGKFDYLKSYCNVVYIERTRGISSSQIRESDYGILKLGIIGYGRIANRFIRESKFVSGINIEGAFGINLDKVSFFANKHELNFFESNIDNFLDKVDAVYIASPHNTHYEYIKKSLLKGKHVLCEKPLVLNYSELMDVIKISKKNSLVLMEAVKTAYSPGFLKLLSIAKSGIIGQIKHVSASFSKLIEGDFRELRKSENGGSFTELGTYPLLIISKLFGTNYKSIRFTSYFDESKNVDLFTNLTIVYEHGIGIANTGLGVKTDGQLIISGTKGFIYVPSPWWKTEYFELKSVILIKSIFINLKEMD